MNKVLQNKSKWSWMSFPISSLIITGLLHSTKTEVFILAKLWILTRASLKKISIPTIKKDTVKEFTYSHIKIFILAIGTIIWWRDMDLICSNLDKSIQVSWVKAKRKVSAFCFIQKVKNIKASGKMILKLDSELFSLLQTSIILGTKSWSL